MFKTFLNEYLSEPKNMILVFSFTLTAFFLISWFKLIRNLKYWKQKYENVLFVKKINKEKYDKIKEKYNKNICLYLLTKSKLIEEIKNLENNLESLRKQHEELETEFKIRKEIFQKLNSKKKTRKINSENFEQKRKRPKRACTNQHYKGLDELDENKNDEDYVE